MTIPNQPAVATLAGLTPPAPLAIPKYLEQVYW
jgi:hypothetical protein